MSKPWPKVRLGEVIRHRKEFITIDDLANYRRPRVQLHAQGIVLRDEVPGALIKTKAQQVCRAGEFLVAEIDAKLGGYGIVPEVLDGTIVSSHYFLFVVEENKLDRRFLDFFIRTPGFREQIEAQGSTNYAAIRPSHVLDYTMPLPTLPEQRRVVARIEELAAQIDEARTLRQQAVEEVEALDSTLSSKCLRAVKKTEALGELIAAGTSISYGVLVPGPKVEDGVPFIRIQDLAVKNAPPRPSKRISREAERAYARTRLNGGEVLVAVVGATIGKIGVVPDSWRGANIARAVCRIVPGPRIDRDFLVHVLQSVDAQTHFRVTTRTLAQPTLNVRQLEQTRIPVPPLHEQRRIVAELDALQAQVDELKQLQAETAAELDALLPSILDRAFKGNM